MPKVRRLKSDQRQIQRESEKWCKGEPTRQPSDNAHSNVSAELPEPKSSINTDRTSRIKDSDSSQRVHREKQIRPEAQKHRLHKMRTPTAREEDNMCLEAQKTGLTKKKVHWKTNPPQRSTTPTSHRWEHPQQGEAKLVPRGPQRSTSPQESTAKYIRLKVKKQRPHPKESTHQKSQKWELRHRRTKGQIHTKSSNKTPYSK